MLGVPEPVHSTAILASVSKRHAYIGDIQGCSEELERLLDRLRFDPASDELLLVGDLVNRGPDSLGTLRLLSSLGARSVLGNHDLHLLRVAAGRRELRADDTFGDVLAADDRGPLLAWLGSQPFARNEDGVLLVHAGVKADWGDPAAVLAGKDPLEPDEDTDFATRVRYCSREGNRPPSNDPSPGAPYAPWFTFLEASERTIVFGHWSLQGLVERPGLRGLDTGCVWGGTLTAWIAEEDRVVQVPAARRYGKID